MLRNDAPPRNDENRAKLILRIGSRRRRLCVHMCGRSCVQRELFAPVYRERERMPGNVWVKHSLNVIELLSTSLVLIWFVDLLCFYSAPSGMSCFFCATNAICFGSRERSR